MNSADYSQPRRQSPRGLVLYFGQSVWKFFKAVWPILLVSVIRNEQFLPILNYVYLGIGVLTLVILTHVILHFYHFFYFLDDKEFVIQKGYLKKVRIAVPYDRIQSINSKQNILQRILRVETLELDTAGSKGQEVQLIALDNSQIAELKSQFAIRRNSAHSSEITSETEQEVTIPEVQEKLLLKLDFGDLIKIGISENHIKSLFIVLALVGGFIQQLQEIFTGMTDSYEEEVKNYFLKGSIVLVSALTFLLLIVGIAYSMIRVILLYFDLHFSRLEKHFKLKSGLLNKKEWTIPYRKIQVLSWSTNPLRKWMDFVSVKFFLASSDQTDDKKNIQIPGLNTRKKGFVFQEIFGDSTFKWSVSLKPHKVFFIRFFIFTAILPLITPALFFYDEWIFWVMAMVWAGFWLWMTILRLRKRIVNLNLEMLEQVSGMIGEEHLLVELYKVQRITLNQSWLQRRRGLATLVLHTAGGELLTIPYIAIQDARLLSNYLLYKVESSSKEWM